MKLDAKLLLLVVMMVVQLFESIFRFFLFAKLEQRFYFVSFLENKKAMDQYREKKLAEMKWIGLKP